MSTSHSSIRRLQDIAAGLVCAVMLAACSSSTPRMGEPRQPYQLRIEQEFRAADIDGDEQLTPEEYRAGWPNDEVAFETLDTDANGRLSLAELMAYADWRRIANRPLDPRWY